MKKLVAIIGCIALLTAGCSKVRKVGDVGAYITKDITLPDQEALMEKYTDRVAWTRVVLEDLTEREIPGEPKKGIIPRDTKVEIIDLNFAFNGSVTIQDYGTYGAKVPKRRMIVHGLEVERPLSVEKYEKRLNETFWFKSPMLRHVDYIRQWGKKTARAVRNHEVFIGMPSEAAMESWGQPTEINVNEIGGNREEQWVYKLPKKSNYIYISSGKVTKWEQ